MNDSPTLQQQEPPEDSIPLRAVVFSMAVLCVVASSVFVKTAWWMTGLFLLLICAGSFLSYKFRHNEPRWMQYIWWIGILLVGANAMQEFTGPLRDEFDFVSPFVHFLCGIFAFVTFSMRTRSDLNTASGLGLILLCLSAPVAKGLPYGICVLGYLTLGAVMMYFDCVSRTLTSWMINKITPAPEIPIYNKNKRLPRGNTVVLLTVVPLLALAMFLYVPRADEALDKIWAYTKTMRVEYLTEMFYKAALPEPPKNEPREHTARDWFNKNTDVKQLPMTGRYAPKSKEELEKIDKKKEENKKALAEKKKQEEQKKKEEQKKEKAKKEEKKDEKPPKDDKKKAKPNQVEQGKQDKAKTTADLKPTKVPKLAPKAEDKNASKAEQALPPPNIAEDPTKGQKKEEAKEPEPGNKDAKAKGAGAEGKDGKGKDGKGKDGAPRSPTGNGENGEKKAKTKSKEKGKAGGKDGKDGGAGSGGKNGGGPNADTPPGEPTISSDDVLMIGDKHKLDERLVFTVKSRRLVYLRRQCYDFYTGKSWTRSVPKKKDEKKKDTKAKTAKGKKAKGKKGSADQVKDNDEKSADEATDEQSSEEKASDDKNADDKAVGDAVDEDKLAAGKVKADTADGDKAKAKSGKSKDNKKGDKTDKSKGDKKSKVAAKADKDKADKAKADKAKADDKDKDKELTLPEEKAPNRVRVVDGEIKKDPPKPAPRPVPVQRVPTAAQYNPATTGGVVRGSQPSVFGNAGTDVIRGSQPSVFGNTNPGATPTATADPQPVRVEAQQEPKAEEAEVKKDDGTIRPFIFETTDRPIFRVGMADALKPESTLPTVELVQEIKVKAKSIGNVVPAGWIPQEVKMEKGQKKIGVDDLGVITSPKPILKDAEIKVKTELPIYPIEAMRQELPLSPKEEDEIRTRYKQYLQLPKTVNEGMFKLAEDNSDPRYNWFVQSQQICDYLRGNFEYHGDREANLDAPDMVQDFLFETGKGTTADFASAFVMLTRCIGIPSRVVCGFAPGDHNPISGEQEVRMKHKLIWAEAYIPNFGWVPFDAHPDGVLPAQQRENRYTQQEVEKQLAAANPWLKIKWTDVATYVVSGLISLIVGFIVFKLLVKALRKWRESMVGRGPEWKQYRKVVKAVKKSMKLTRNPEETPTEFLERVAGIIDERKAAGKVAPEALPEALKTFLTTYSAVYFGRQKQEMEHLKYHAEQVVKVTKSVKMTDIVASSAKSAVRRKDEFKEDMAASSAVRRKK